MQPPTMTGVNWGRRGRLRHIGPLRRARQRPIAFPSEEGGQMNAGSEEGFLWAIVTFGDNGRDMGHGKAVASRMSVCNEIWPTALRFTA